MVTYSPANITPAEIAIVVSAAMLLVVGPALVALSAARRRRVASATPEWTPPSAPPESVEVGVEWQSAASPMEVAAPLYPSTEAGQVATFSSMQPEEAGVAVVESAASSVLPTPSFVAEASVADAPSPQPSPPLLLEPMDVPARYTFRLADLHTARLPDWPPAAITQDPARDRSWREAESVAAQHQTAIAAATICAPYPARASCLGEADADSVRACLRYLLFPVLWPVSQNQAVAQAVFEVDRITGAVRGWVDALKPHELSEENRREIREAGGEA